MHQGERARLVAKCHGPIEGRVAAAADHQVLIEEFARRLHPVVHIGAFQFLGAGNAQAPRLEGTDARRDDYSTRSKLGSSRGGDVELAVLQYAQLGHFLPEVERRLEGLRLLEQAINQLLRPADGQGRNVLDRLVRIKLGALTARLTQGIDDVGADAEQAQLEYLKKPHGTRADDHRFNVLFRHVKPTPESNSKSARIVTECTLAWGNLTS